MTDTKYKKKGILLCILFMLLSHEGVLLYIEFSILNKK